MYNLQKIACGNAPYGDRQPRVYKFHTEEKPKQYQSGIFDSSILCSDCDGILGVWDGYVQRLLINHSSKVENLPYAAKQNTNNRIDIFNYNYLKLFFMSVLWRAGITKHHVFSKVDLGPWEEKLRKMISRKEPGSEKEFSVILCQYMGEFSEIMIDPIKLKYKGVNYYRFRIPNYVFLIKVDQRNFDSRLTQYILSPNKPLNIYTKDYMKSIERKLILENIDSCPH